VRGRRIGHQRQGIERGGGGIARGREESRAESRVGGGKRARGRLEAHGEKLRRVPACLLPFGVYSNLNRLNCKPNGPHIGPVKQPQKTVQPN
jgi:hypothetical protein